MRVRTASDPRAVKAHILARLRDRVMILDGGMGSLLQENGLEAGRAPEAFMLENPERLVEIHAAYVRAGADMIITNTFGASPLKLRDHGLEDRCEEINRTAVRLARKAAGERAWVVADIGPSGQFLKPIGSLRFEDALANFEVQMQALVKEKPDAVIMETVADLREARAVAMAVRKHFDGLFIAQMTFTGDGTTVTGTDPLTFATVLLALGADVVGANCSVGPKDLLDIIETLGRGTDAPISVEPNAGLPELKGDRTVYPATPGEFAQFGPALVRAGASLIGGCCGTTPEFIRALRKAVDGLRPELRPRPTASRLCSRFLTVEIDDRLPVRILGERINPTARKKFSLELREGVLTTVRKEAVRQEKAGASILDVNVGVEGVNEVELMRRAVNMVQESARLPLSLDSADPEVLEAGLREVVGKCLINSVNGEAEKLEAVLPLAKRYGAAVLGLTMDERGIPGSVEERLAIAERIVEAADRFGIPREDVYIDPLCLTVSSHQAQALHTLEALGRLKSRFGVRTVLGLSNISYGLPERAVVNRAFLSMALHAGLDVPIANPLDEELCREIRACDLVLGRDAGGKRYIEAAAAYAGGAAPTRRESPKAAKDPRKRLYQAVIDGDRDNILTYLDRVLEVGILPQEANEKILIPALLEVGRRFDSKEFYLPQVILAAEAMQSAFGRIKDLLPRDDTSMVRGRVVLATVKGDVHDIGKNIVGAILESHGYRVTDLGKSVEAERIAEAALETEADVVGLSALMTTTMTEMKEVIRVLRERDARASVIIGGAVTTRAYADAIGAEGYAPDALSAVPEIARLMKKRT